MLPLPIVVLDPDMPNVNRFLAIILPVVVHTLVGNFVEPYVFGSSMELHPIVVLLSLAFWYSIWGIPGAILSVPITAVMRIILSHSNNMYATFFLRLLQGELSLPEINRLALDSNSRDRSDSYGRGEGASIGVDDNGSVDLESDFGASVDADETKELLSPNKQRRARNARASLEDSKQLGV